MTDELSTLDVSRRFISESQELDMRDQIFIIMRFSVLTAAKENWQLGRGRELDEVREMLFDEERLRQKFQLFESLTLPSLQKQEFQGFTLIVMTSEYLPEVWKRRLYQLQTSYLASVKRLHGAGLKSDFVIEEVEIGDYKKQALEITHRHADSNVRLIATARLDDDDALHPTFMHRVKELMVAENANKVVSFSGGCYVTLTPELRIEQTDLRLISAGLTYITTLMDLQTIYCLGRHTRLHLNNECIEDRTPWMYAMAAGEFCDSGRTLTAADSGLREECLQHYPFLADTSAS